MFAKKLIGGILISILLSGCIGPGGYQMGDFKISRGEKKCERIGFKRGTPEFLQCVSDFFNKD